MVAYKQVLKDSYDGMEQFTVSKDQMFDLSRQLISVGREASANIVKIATMLNRKRDDSYFVVYGLLMQYNDKLIDWNTKAGLSDKAKIEALKESCGLISKNLDNREFMDQLYKDVRSGANIDKIYYPKELNKELIQLKNFDAMLEVLKTSERF